MHSNIVVCTWKGVMETLYTLMRYHFTQMLAVHSEKQIIDVEHVEYIVACQRGGVSKKTTLASGSDETRVQASFVIDSLT